MYQAQKKPRITRLHYPSPNDLLCQVDWVDETLLECINLAESTLNAEEQNTPKAKFNKEFDDCMKGLEPLGSGPIQINLEFLDPNDDREFINYLNNLTTWKNGQMTLTCSWKVWSTPTKLKNSGTSQRPKECGKTSNPTNNTSSNNPLPDTTIAQPYKWKTHKRGNHTWHHGQGWESPHQNPLITPQTFLLGYETQPPSIGRLLHLRSQLN